MAIIVILMEKLIPTGAPEFVQLSPALFFFFLADLLMFFP